MNLRELGHLLEDTPFWKEGFVIWLFNLLPVFLVIVIIIGWFLYLGQAYSWHQCLVLGSLILVILALTLCIWGYNFERFDLKVVNQNVKVGFDAKIALFSDIHIGRFKDKTWVNKVIDQTNEIPNLDVVLVAGDWTYYPKTITKEAFVETFAGLRNSRYPIYAVMGNHDVQKPGPRLRTELELAFDELGVKVIDNRSVEFEKWRLVGLEDIWSEQFDGVESDLFSTNKPNIVLTHQPDIVRQYDKLVTKPILTLTGHTHCGQVRIPFLYKLVLPTIDGYYDKGWYDVDGGKLFITCGVGEVGLPIRLFNPPTIDVLSFY